ncbi:MULTISPECIES: hypothetical protein [unclassified Wolbachia]|uniref:hypothetical protein n=1 Tax=unclassified Wolbachia TaxID=2640676 RepID=UPI0021F8374D|nr:MULTISPECIES: hypothetical protein [unclassified Wolbachia]
MFIKNKLMSLNFINAHRASSKDFSRKRKLPFVNVFLLIFRKYNAPHKLDQKKMVDPSRKVKG